MPAGDPAPGRSPSRARRVRALPGMTARVGGGGHVHGAGVVGSRETELLGKALGVARARVLPERRGGTSHAGDRGAPRNDGRGSEGQRRLEAAPASRL